MPETTPNPQRPVAPPSTAHRLLRVIALALLLGILGLIVYGALGKQRWPRDMDFMLVRWPLWVIAVIGVPLLALRIVTWRRRRRRPPAPKPPASAS